MLYQKPKFTLPATEGKGDCSSGHAMLDVRGRCIRCGEKAGAATREQQSRLVEQRRAS